MTDRRLLGGGAVALLGATAVFFLLDASEGPQVTPSPSDAVTTGASPEPVATSDESKESPKTSSPARAIDSRPTEPLSTERTEITLTANTDFETVTVGDRAVVLPAPTKTATIHLREDEQKARLSLVAVTKDGRRSHAILAPADESVAVTFREPKKSVRPTPSPAPRPSTKPKSSDLAASPY